MTAPNNQPVPEGFLRLSSKWLETNDSPENLIFIHKEPNNFRWFPSALAGTRLPQGAIDNYWLATALTDLPPEAYENSGLPQEGVWASMGDHGVKQLLPEDGEPGAEVASERAEERTVRFVSAVSGLQYEKLEATGDIMSVIVGGEVFSKSSTADKMIATLRAQLEAKEAELRAWHEYYIAGILLDDIDYTHPEHDAAVKRIVSATEALTPMSDGTLARELNNTREWIERESKEREAHQTENDKLRAEAEELKREVANVWEAHGRMFNEMVDKTTQIRTLTAELDAVRKELGQEKKRSQRMYDDGKNVMRAQRDAAQARCGVLEQAGEYALRVLAILAKAGEIPRTGETPGNWEDICEAETQLRKLLTPSQPDNLNETVGIIPTAETSTKASSDVSKLGAEAASHPSCPEPVKPRIALPPGHYPDSLENPVEFGEGPPKPVKAGEWLPIESAPKSSKSILVHCSDLKNTYAVTWDGDGYGGGEWRVFGGYPLDQTPTHWCPQVAPPIVPEGKATEGEG